GADCCPTSYGRGLAGGRKFPCAGDAAASGEAARPYPRNGGAGCHGGPISSRRAGGGAPAGRVSGTGAWGGTTITAPIPATATYGAPSGTSPTTSPRPSS